MLLNTIVGSSYGSTQLRPMAWRTPHARVSRNSHIPRMLLGIICFSMLSTPLKDVEGSHGSRTLPALVMTSSRSWECRKICASYTYQA